VILKREKDIRKSEKLGSKFVVQSKIRGYVLTPENTVKTAHKKG